MSPTVQLDLRPFPGESGFICDSRTDNSHGEAIVAVISSVLFQAGIGVLRYTVHHNIPAVPENISVRVPFPSILGHRLRFLCLLCGFTSPGFYHCAQIVPILLLSTAT